MNHPRSLLALPSILLAALGALAPAQFSQAVPHQRTGDLLVLDGGSSPKTLWRFMDLNLDGDWNDTGEIATFAVFTNTLTNVAVGPDGSVYVAEAAGGVGTIWRLQDLDGDGAAMSPGETQAFFTSGTNASGVVTPSPQAVTVSADGTVWIASANTSSGVDSIVRLFDTGDGDANDLGEAIVYAAFPTAGGVSTPTGICVGADGAIYYLENGSGGKGIYRLHDDAVPNGVCTDPGEVTAFYTPAPPAPSPSAQFFGMTCDRNGNFWISDTSFERILRVKDQNPVDQTITLGSSEESLWFQTPSPSLMWNVAAASDGAVYAVEDQGASDRIYKLVDLNADGDASDANELTTVYDHAVAPGSPSVAAVRALAFLKAPYIQASPNPIPIGTSVSFLGEAAASNLFNAWASVQPDSFAFAPYGTVGIGVSIPGTYSEVVPTFALPASGSFSFSTPIANDVGLIGQTFYLQAIAGPPARLQLSNVIAVTFQ